MAQPPRQFVLLHHVLPDDAHLDLCIEQGETLATWQLTITTTAEISHADAIPARRIQDHRRIYLDYEGPVSGNRGDVTRVDRGTCEILQREPDRWLVRLAGSVLIGTYEIAATADPPGWVFSYRTC